MPRRLLRLLVVLLLTHALAAASAAGATDPATLEPGQYLWHPEIAPAGPIVLVVSLDEQRAYVYRNGIAIGVSTISSGKTGKETPTGVFTILQKNRDHRSNLYNNAPMPYMQRLTWDGIALHGGTLPGYPASQGCVRLPHEFARLLFAETRNGDTVVVADGKASPARLVHPAVLAPVDRSGAGTLPPPAPRGDYWDEDASPAGPVSVLVSLGDRRVFALRNGVAIGEAALQVEEGFVLGGTLLMVAGAEQAGTPSRLDPERPRRQWSAHPIHGIDADAMAMLQLRLQSMPLRVDDAFARRLLGVVSTGSTVLLTDLPAVRPAPADAPLVPVLESGEPEVD